ncbi:1353_t:CDS:2, partial [Gigaspora margarita]
MSSIIIYTYHYKLIFVLVSSDELDEMLNAVRGNLRIEDRYSPKDMHADLEALAANRELTVEEIPRVKTIKEWIERSSAYFQEGSIRKS